jgi:hypothetical protein
LALLKSRPYDAALGEQLLKRARAVKLDAPPRFIERPAPYAGTGITSRTYSAMVDIDLPTKRASARFLNAEFLCAPFASVSVDRDAVLAAVGEGHQNVRSLDVTDAPMRHTPGCSGCHAPMDAAAAMMLEISSPLFGSMLTGLKSEGSLFVLGAADLRGNGAGAAALTKLVVEQPEFARCAVERAFKTLVGRGFDPASEVELESDLLELFLRSKQDWTLLLRAILASDAYQQG